MFGFNTEIAGIREELEKEQKRNEQLRALLALVLREVKDETLKKAVETALSL